MRTFVHFLNRYTLSCELESDQCLHVGSGEESETSDAGFITRDGYPFLPGSSLRGVLRSNVERTLRALFPEPVACVLFEDEALPEALCDWGNRARRERIETGELKLDAGDLRLCPVCRMFGSTLMAARLRITDAVQKGTRMRTDVRDGVGIDRDTESAKESIKYDFEVLNPGVTFDFRMILENAEDDEFALLYILLKELQRGVAVGGKRNRGFGDVRLVKYSVEYFEREGLADFLLSGKQQLMTGEELDRKAQSAFAGFVLARRHEPPGDKTC